jgi:hypothetical protein
MLEEGGLSIAGGALTIVAAFLALIMGNNVISFWFSDFLYTIITWWLSIIGFAFGIASGALMIKKRSFALTVVGMAVLLIVGILPLIWSFIYIEEFLRYLWTRMLYIYGVPIIVLSALSIVFAVASRKRFS